MASGYFGPKLFNEGTMMA
ncbi:hypothetical protein ALC60_11821 [Trachymyrmex zeteki]|uniref:Uncharacterized protein n=1 Tax=Mycetomoellerius zeteki TaxID=64791 RepID=A0A151WMJ8_9HYME|nr:hypothetical protein ALC60_11821 [Trachymyrmex zeteki]